MNALRKHFEDMAAAWNSPLRTSRRRTLPKLVELGLEEGQAWLLNRRKRRAA